MEKDVKNEFDKVYEEFGKMRKFIEEKIEHLTDHVSELFAEVKQEVREVKNELDSIKNVFATKDYVDRRFADFAKANNMKVREDDAGSYKVI